MKILTRDLKILLLEDTVADAELVERELRKAGLSYTARRVETREEFVAALRDFSPDIVLADYAMPSFGAVLALRELRAAGSNTPLILVTGSNSEEVAVECIKEGAHDYILKPSLARLPRAMANALQQRDAELARAESERAFRQSQEQYRLIAENTHDLICLLDSALKFLYASPSYARVLEQAPDQMLGQPADDLVHPGDRRLFREMIDEARFFREGRNLELRLRHARGKDAWVSFECTVSIIFGTADAPQRVLMVSRDFSERKRAEQEIRKLAAFPKVNPNPVLEFAADGTLTYFNDAALKMAELFKKSHPEALLPLNTANIVKTCLASGQNRLHIQTHMGERRLSWSFFPVTHNRVVHCYAEDITESLNLEAQLRQAQKMDSIGQLAAGVAHDFNNILTVIHGHAGLLKSTPGIDPDTLDSVQQISIAAERATNLTRQLLTFSRKTLLQLQLINLNDSIDELSKMLRSLVGETITLKRELQDDLPSVHADPGMMEQVLVNLAVNARDAMPKGGVLTISTEVIETDEEYVRKRPDASVGVFVRLSVTDVGHGMDSQTLTHIFEPFFTTKEIGKGTGLGLATIYGIIEQHHGWLEVKSAIGVGTTFMVHLPVSAKSPEVVRRQDKGDVPGGDETILLVEDEEPLRELVYEILEKKGYTVIQAANGVEALRLWGKHRDTINLVLTDMMMPEGISGRDLAERVLADRPEIKVIYSTGYSLDVLGSGLTFKEGTNFLQKPYDPETLARTVRSCLNS
jgi:PAS domain S-box-containing protein